MFYNKLVKALTRSTVLVSLLMLIGGCQSFRPGPAPYRGQECPTEPAACDDSNIANINSPEFLLEKIAPPAIALGQNFDYHYRFLPRVNAKDARIEEMLPDGMSYVSSTPEAQVDGQKITWSFPAVKAGECIEICLTLKPEDSGCFSSCASAFLTPIACATTFIGEPLLTITKECNTGPCLVGDAVTFDIFVKNTGNFPAHDVVVTDIIPEGLTHASGRRELTLNLGTLNAGESRSSHINLLACDRGEFCNKARVTSCNAATQETSACCKVTKPGLGIEKTGTSEQIIGQEAEYTVTVTNIGDADLSNVLVTDLLPPTTQLVQAEGGTANGREIHWTIGNLPAGESESFNITVTGCSLGECCNEAAASLCDGQLLVKDSACTLWKGVPNVCMRMSTTCDPICECEETTHIIEVSNAGTAPDNNVMVVANITDNLEPLNADGPTEHRISGQVVEFAPLSTLGPNNSAVYRITTRATKSGDARINVTVSADNLESPINREDTTQIY